MNKLKLILLILPLIYFEILGQNSNWEIYDQMQYPVARGQLVVANDIIYILGGYSPNLQRTVDWIQKYNPILTGVWKDFGNMQLQRGGFVADLFQGSIYYCGGVHESIPNSGSLEKWDLTQTGNFVKNDINFTRTYAAGKILGNNFYLVGGNPSGTDNYLPYIISINMQTYNVTVLENNLYYGRPLPEHQMMEILGSAIYIFGGVIYGISQDIYRFDLNSKIIEKLPIQLLQPRAAGAAVAIPSQNQIYIIGGFNESNNSLSSVEIFRVTTTDYEINQGPELNNARNALMAGRTSDNIFVLGGFDETGNVVTSVERLEDPSTGIDDKADNVINDFKLLQNYPNPFNSTTNIMFNLEKPVTVSLDVYSILGEHLKNIVRGELNNGAFHYQWDGIDKQSNPLPSGIYLYKLTSGSTSKSFKMVLLR